MIKKTAAIFTVFLLMATSAQARDTKHLRSNDTYKGSDQKKDFESTHTTTHENGKTSSTTKSGHMNDDGTYSVTGTHTNVKGNTSTFDSEVSKTEDGLSATTDRTRANGTEVKNESAWTKGSGWKLKSHTVNRKALNE